MDARVEPAVHLRPHGFSLRGDAVAAGAIFIGVVVAAFALLVFGRRLAGALEGPAPAAVLVGSAAAVGGLASYGRLLWRRAQSQHDPHAAGAWSGVLVTWTPSVCLLLLAIGLSWPFGRFLDWLIWTPLWIADFVWRTRFVANAPRQRENIQLRSAVVDGIDGAGPGVDLDEDESGVDDDVVLQRIMRFRDPRGRDCLSGSLRAEFAPGERSTHVYVSFCPPFESTPMVEVEQSDGPPARISLGQIRPHGARIDVRLGEEPLSASQVAFELFGTCPEPRCTGFSAAV